MGLVGHWTLNESSGDAIDVTGNGNDGAVNGATQGATGILGETAYSFDGTDDWVNIGDKSELGQGLGSNLSFTAWFNIASSKESRFFTKASSSNNDSYLLGISDNNNDGTHNQIRFYFDNGSSSTNLYSPPITIGEWNFVSGTYDGSTLYLYTNGSKVTSTSFSGSIASASGSNVSIGARNGEGYFFDGRIADARIYDHALTPNEVAYLYEVPHRQQYISNTLTS